MFSRVAIVNRGEAAMRLIHAVGELNGEGGPRIETVALYTDADSTATFVREADVAYCLGPAENRPYLDLAVLERALVETGADAAWVGWGFVAEDPAFAELCARLGITFIGPDAEAMRKLGDKIGAKLIAEEVGVPVAPWSRGPVETLDAALEAAQRIGYPLMLKATAGGGGRGIRLVTGPDELTDAYERTSLEAERAFGSGVVFLERLVTGARHVEVQVIADGQGTAWALGVRDCSVQRRNQKIIEESASPVLSAEQADELKAAAERLTLAVGYRGAGTVEFLYHPGDKLFAFLEVNTRLQVEHPITEITTDTDLVKAQLHVAAGGRLTGPKPAESGHAVEARLNAEDPDRDFAPAPGRIALLDLPAGPGIRVDTGVSEGDEIPSHFDSMIAKIIAYGRTRDEALGRLRRAMRETTVLIEGGATNKSFVLDLLDQPEVIDGSADTGWIDRVRGEGRLASQRHSGVALAAAAIEAYEDGKRVELRRLLTTANGGRPQVQHEVGRAIDLSLRGAPYRLTVAETGPGRYRVGFVDGDDVRTVEAALERFDEHTGRIVVDGTRFRLVTGTHGTVHLVEVDGVTHRVSRDEGGVVRSPAPALVVATPVAAGDEVEAGAPVLVLESMKMETVLRAPARSLVRECVVSVGSQVGAGAPLLRLEPLDDAEDDTAAAAEAVDLDLPVAGTLSAADRVARGLADLRAALLGFDVDPVDAARTAKAYQEARAELPHRPLAAEVGLLDVFADLAELTRNKPDGAEDTWASSPREHFHTYLQSLDAERAGLSEAFQGRLTRVLAHYGVDGLDRTPALEEAVFRIFLAQRRASSDAAVVIGLLRRWLTEAPPGGELRQVVGQALERLVVATQLRFPVLGDLARSVVFRWFAQPLLRRKRAEVYTRVRRHLRHLDRHPDAADRDERIADMVSSPEPLVRLLGRRIDRPGLDGGPLLEVLCRRYYREYGLTDVRCEPVAGRPFVTGAYELDGRPQRLLATIADIADLPAALAGIAGLAGAAEESTALVVDVYLTWVDRPADVDVLAAELRETLSATALPGRLRRLTVTVAEGDGGVGHHHFTFRPSSTGLTEERLIRGLHPLVGQRLQLWRLRHFDLTRLPSVDEDVHLLRCVAPKNPADERLVAMAQVRDLTPLSDSEGRILALPAVEGALAACLDAIRKVQAQRPATKRLDTNRVVLYVWPASDLAADDLASVAQRVLPTTAGAGIEEVLFLGRRKEDGRVTPIAVRLTFDATTGVRIEVTEPPAEPVQPLDDYGQKVLRARRRGTVYPYELTDMIAGPGGSFTEYDLTDSAVLAPAERAKGLNKAGIVVGVATTPTTRYPEGMTRVVLLGDPTKALGALSEPECARVIAALDLAERLRVPVEWYALSAGARIAMDSGTENMDWIAAALKRIVHFTQDGGEINIVVAGINVGAQPYWNAEATMLMHTKGILVMTPDSAMVLTGKQSLDFSGGVSAEDNFGIGGHDRVMGPNGQAQYWAPDLRGAHGVLLAHYEHSYVLPGEEGPRLAGTTDPVDRDVSDFPHSAPDSDFTTVGQIFSRETNPDRKKPFDIRAVMRAVADQDHPVLERWAGMADAETAVVQDVHLGGRPVCLLGIESRSVQRRGFPPTDGPDTYTAGTLFPRSSKKVARAINAASGNRPVVVLANLSGFDGSPESMRKLQLEYGAEIGRAIVNFEGPIVFCVISRYHGGAFVVFSKALNPNMTVLAVDGSYASVLGGAPAAAVVFAGDVNARTAADPRVTELEERVAAAAGTERAALVARLADVRTSVRAEKLGEVATEFDGVHSIQRAQRVGSVDAIIRPQELRPSIVAAVENGKA
ncbi:biotin carboxylase N-terminal domain-containing protein [Saccharothrix violaceirubra]|uniref:Acetyl/propionyl-CoA carboxylase alpha subunit/acetyl-CoA carboxylase carboxyltransferase component n=1 Tax=Saccharothrix violaceirubra TaxID=413306 RepID=A0A7W7WUW1_9PSEU|nr:carboxyl transferase domain-containing protein [Saccharothrix violaceirubra]MBB4964262.1 acetyl/propionyl-CoA carboxylase alpha subunit/acetyl-CoA carboxylase carboxyltransferase component [Saccharothrix violaceirubra]